MALLPAATHAALCGVLQRWVEENRDPEEGADELRALDAAFASLPTSTFVSVFRQLCQRHLKSQIRVHRRGDTLDGYIADLEAGVSLVDLAARARFSSWQIGRLVLERRFGISKTTVSAWCRDLRLIPDASLREQMRLAARTDRLSSPAIDRARHLVGVRYEEHLGSLLRAMAVPFVSEDASRRAGQARTPDALLSIPIGVEDEAGTPHVVHWIDSKAMFADLATHEDNNEQLQAYANRYGPGLVVYWFGCTEDVVRVGDPSIVVRATFPARFVLPGDSETRVLSAESLAAPVVPSGRTLALEWEETVASGGHGWGDDDDAAASGGGGAGGVGGGGDGGGAAAGES